MKRTLPTLGAVLALGCCVAGPAAAEPPSSAVESADLPEPARLLQRVALFYPEDAGSQHGDVVLLVEVGIDGVTGAVQVESGPEVFFASALEAASRLVFEPARSDGVAVASVTRIHFHFAPPSELDDDATMEIVVHGDHPDLEDTKARTTLDRAALERAAGQDLAGSVEEVPGVTVGGGTTSAAKPIIRGQQERRLLVLVDGVRHESQKWGPDHGTEVDPFSAGSITVIRGAAGARYGPDAMGGVLLVNPPPLRTDPGVQGTALGSFASNGTRPFAGLRLDAVPAALPALSLRLEGNAAVGASRHTPDYVLGNTASRAWNLGATAAVRLGTSQLRASWRHHDLAAGVFHGVRSATPAEFEAQLEAGVPEGAERWEPSFAIERAYQAVSHDLALLHLATHSPLGTADVRYAYQHNRRREYEQVRDGVAGPQYDFTLRTHSLDAELAHPEAVVGDVTMSGGVGLQAGLQENVYQGLTLLPNARSFSGGLFAYERASVGRADVELGGRYDGLLRTAFLDDADYQRHVRRGSLDASHCSTTEEAARCPGAYGAASLSAGALLHVVPEHLDVKVDLARASRFPDLDELYLLGSAPSLPAFALGFPDLGVETSTGATVTSGLRLPWLQAELSGFASRIDNYVQFAPEIGADGQPRFEVTVRGAFPRFTYTPLRPWSHGGEATVDLGPTAPVGLRLQGAVVRITADGQELVGTAPDRFDARLLVRPQLAGVDDTELSLIATGVARQFRVDPERDLAPAPDGVVLLGAAAQATLGSKLRVGIELRNLLDARYREYTSLLRYYADQPGRDFRLRVGMDF